MDLYALLGLAPGATPADIKRAYRRLSRRYHPDINPGDKAAEIVSTSASRTPTRRWSIRSGAAPTTPRVEHAGSATTRRSSSPDLIFRPRRTAAGGHVHGALRRSAPSATPPDTGRPQPGADIHATLTVPFEDSMHGAERQVVVTRQDVCGGCGGAGIVRTPEGKCAPCHGTGNVRWARGHMVFTKSCAACHGSGRQRTARCGVCAGQGRHVRSEAVPVRVPPGVPRARGCASPTWDTPAAAARATAISTSPCTCSRTPVFRRQGDDLCMVMRDRRPRRGARHARRSAVARRTGQAAHSARHPGRPALPAARSRRAAAARRTRRSPRRNSHRLAAGGGRARQGADAEFGKLYGS